LEVCDVNSTKYADKHKDMTHTAHCTTCTIDAEYLTVVINPSNTVADMEYSDACVTLSKCRQHQRDSIHLGGETIVHGTRSVLHDDNTLPYKSQVTTLLSVATDQA